MKPCVEQLLYYLLWTADPFLQGSWRNLDESFETWAWRHRLTRRLAELERLKLIDRDPDSRLGRIVRLTEEGRRHALGGRDPAACWNRPWDGQWRLILFDLPIEKTDLRKQLWRVLRRHHFGYLQGSVWATPDPAGKLRASLGEAPVDAEAFLIIEGRPAAGETDAEIVEAAWDFPRLNRRYEQYLHFIERRATLDARLPEWARRENAAWRAAAELDPFLPRALHPEGYLGTEAFRRRKLVFAGLAADL